MDLGVILSLGILLVLNIISIICLYSTKIGKDYIAKMSLRKKILFTVYMGFVGIAFWIILGIGSLIQKAHK